MENYREAAKHTTRSGGNSSYKLSWASDDPVAVRYAVAHDAVALVGEPARLARVIRCPGRHCGWLVLNLSGRRRWCSMTTCGTREKMRRLHQRRKLDDDT
jgi:predicted RNA-binding Zn ribbon-like protein